MCVVVCLYVLGVFVVVSVHGGVYGVVGCNVRGYVVGDVVVYVVVGVVVFDDGVVDVADGIGVRIVVGYGDWWCR